MLHFKKFDEKTVDIDNKMDELIMLLSQSDIDSELAKSYLKKLENAVTECVQKSKNIEAFEVLNDKQASREQLLENLSLLLEQNPVDSNISKKYIRRNIVKKTVLTIIGLLMVAMGMGMIIIPAPPYFEMFTIFYFNGNDGVTLMDIISLLIVLSGIYLIVRTLLNLYAKTGTDN
jgi:hypothetical protein